MTTTSSPKLATKKVELAVSGITGSNSEHAGWKFLRENKVPGRIIYSTSISNTFHQVTSGRVKLGLVPIMNSIGGLVEESIAEMSRHKFKINQIFDYRIEHCLLVPSGVKRQEIKYVISHPQALKQCSHYLKRSLPKAKQVEYIDTALAAKDLSNGKLPKKCGVIASHAASELFDLQALKCGIQNEKSNTTTFMVFSK